jgi:hypothetical protein
LNEAHIKLYRILNLVASNSNRTIEIKRASM